MSVRIIPFTADHLDAAAILLAARHRRDRTWAPDLSPEYEEAAATVPVLHELLAADGMSGVVALDAGRVVGYLLGAPEIGSPTRTFAGFMHPRAAEIAYAGQAVDPECGATLLLRLYAAVAQLWVRHGLVGHYVTVPVHRDASEPWWELGFGQFVALGVRATTLPDEPEVLHRRNLEIRRATTEDENVVQAAMTEFFRSFAESPIFVPFLPETTTERRQWVADHLVDPGSPVWLAFANDQLVGLQLFQEPTSAHWHQSPLETPPRSLYLHIAYTVPEGRSTGIGAVLLDHTLAWAREAGYDTCMAHWVTASRAAPFWRGQGFQPVSCWLCRIVDERATWADGRS
jgi:GNAT superfamily N-acetyltransferase